MGRLEARVARRARIVALLQGANAPDPEVQLLLPMLHYTSTRILNTKVVLECEGNEVKIHFLWESNPSHFVKMILPKGSPGLGVCSKQTQGLIFEFHFKENLHCVECNIVHT